jgi:hypothetical protein
MRDLAFRERLQILRYRLTSLLLDVTDGRISVSEAVDEFRDIAQNLGFAPTDEQLAQVRRIIEEVRDARRIYGAVNALINLLIGLPGPPQPPPDTATAIGDSATNPGSSNAP